MTAPAAPDFDLPLRIKAAMYFRLLALQGSWNYETLLGTGVGFVMEPALRLLPGGLDGQAYRAALARESRFRSRTFMPPEPLLRAATCLPQSPTASPNRFGG